MKIARKLLLFLAISLGIYLTIALGLIASQSPGEFKAFGGIDFPRQQSAALTAPTSGQYQARDGTVLPYRRFASGEPAAPLIVVVHGSGWHGEAYLKLASQLSIDLAAEVLVPDLRGHGVKPERRGDVDYIGQLEDDLADLIELNRKPGQRLIMLGHSSGGGLVVRFAGGQYGEMVSRAVLLAPFLKYDAPTTRPNSGGWAKPLTRRIIGLTMLNWIGITPLNGLTAIQFNFPDSVRNGPRGKTLTDAYSFRMNTSFAPRYEYLKDIAALPKFLLVVGSRDEAFFADQYAPLMAKVTPNGQYRIIDRVSHLGVINDRRSLDEIVRFLKERAN